MFHFVSLPFIAAKIDPDGSLEANMEGIMTTPQAKLSAGSLKQQRLADTGTASKKRLRTQLPRASVQLRRLWEKGTE